MAKKTKTDPLEALRRIEEAERTGAGKLDLSALGLGPILSPDWAGWEALARLDKLEQLALNINQIAVIPAEGWNALGRLSGLEWLNLSDNRLTAIPQVGWEALGRLKALEGLSLSENQICDVPTEGWAVLSRLVNLVLLDFSGNNVAISAEGWTALGRLAGLKFLGLGHTETGDIAIEGWEALGRLANLTSLWLYSNNITAIPAEAWVTLSRLPKLGILSLAANEIRDIPVEGWEIQGSFPSLDEIHLEGNPLPPEILAAASRGAKSLFEYLEATRLRAAHPRTVKLVLLGEPASGKSTLVEALIGNPHPCDPDRPETVGVSIQRIEKQSPEDGRPLYLATWDFAGQHMEYATHQFFLKAGGVYLILWKARLGSDYGQRDLWYWLELLKMRVKDPEFLLVTTHTATTPAVLDLRQVLELYPGCKGHFEVELSDGTGVAALERKILELAAASPAIKAVWPAPWLAVRDAIRGMRAEIPYIASDAFWKLCAEKEVTDTNAKHDLADQLDKLGEIVYYAGEPLSRFVILDPTWVSELVAKVVRDKPVRDKGGTLTPSDLDRIWGDLPPAVRDHLENLMDEYDLVYRTLVHSHARPSLVVEALPHAPEEIRNLDITGGRPQTEMIYRFPTLVRHLPPGVPTWAFARSQRYMKAGAGPWRNAARFEDPDTNSEALVLSSEVNREVRIRVAADYPPYFLGVLDGILRDTFKRYPGAQPESLIPCPCQPGCSYGHPWKTVQKRNREGKPEITCPVSGEDVPIAKLLAGVESRHTLAGELAILSDMRRQLTALGNAQNEELIKTCPSMFTLVPAHGFKLLDTYFERATQQEELELMLYCEWDKGWHPTQHSVYRFRPEQEWFHSLKENWSAFVRVTKRVAPLVGPGGVLLGVPAAGITVKKLAEKAEEIAGDLDNDLTGALASELGLRERVGLVDLEARHLLSRLIKHLDSERPGTLPQFGGLHPYHLKEDGRLLWLCSEHRDIYERAR